jgi:hypothetical protein
MERGPIITIRVHGHGQNGHGGQSQQAVFLTAVMPVQSGGQQLRGSVRIAGFDAGEDVRDFVHGLHQRGSIDLGARPS